MGSLYCGELLLPNVDWRGACSGAMNAWRCGGTVSHEQWEQSGSKPVIRGAEGMENVGRERMDFSASKKEVVNWCFIEVEEERMPLVWISDPHRRPRRKWWQEGICRG